MPGETAADALEAARDFAGEGIGVMFTRLGENLVDTSDADGVAEHYVGLLDEIGRLPIDGEISVKLTQLGLDLGVESTFARADRLASRAAEIGGMLWIDMEGSAYVETTIAFYERLKAQRPNVGLCLQAYLHRTAGDLQRLLPLEPGIRLVKGAYAEPASIAYQSRADVDRNYAALAIAMLESAQGGRAVRIGLGTHDVRLIEAVAADATTRGLGLGAFEVQMLYGIRADQQRRLARGGCKVRILIAYGEAWYPWYMRRLAERPANVLFALRQLLP
jgi:proline dehydrogenase